MPYAVYYIPTGPRNLTAMFPAIDWAQVESYYIETTGVQATTPVFKYDNCDDEVVISFINYSGGLDSIGFAYEIEHDVKASTFQRSSKYPLVRAASGTTRLTVHATDNYTLTGSFTEEQMELIAELLDSPLSWMQVSAAQGQPADYIPVIITDQSSVKRKVEDRYSYDVTIKCSLSHERIVISN